MVRQLIQELQGSSVPLTTDELAERLNTDACMVEAMLDNLVRMGKLERIEDEVEGWP
ncbi:MAG: FeoC-like transcriptional regulator, partial [Chloroflexota bacterium]